MSFDVLNRYSANHKPWDHVGNIIPDVEHSEGERPAVEFHVASWLPVQFFDKYYENWIVIMPGKAVALDPDGNVMPAEYGLTSGTVVYAQNDVDAGVTDIATGLPVSVAKTVTLSQLSGTLQSGWTRDNAGVAADHTSGFMGRGGVAFGDSVLKYPIGIAPYAYLQWAGGDGSNPVQYRQHNYNMQHQVAVLCDYVVKLPLVPVQKATETIAKTVTNSALAFGTSHTHTAAYAEQNTTNRYDAGGLGTLPILSTYTVIALALDEYPLAQQTIRTPLVLDSTVTADNAALAALLANEVTSLAAVKKAGDYFVDYPVGVVFLYSSDATTVPTAISGASGTVRLTYYRLNAAASTVSKFASVLGNASMIKAGDFLKVGASSNWVLADPSSDNFASIMGQVIGFETYPRDGLDRVKTAFNPTIGTSAAGSVGSGAAGSASVNLGQMDRMPGSATGGVPDLINFAGAADTMVIVNLVSR